LLGSREKIFLKYNIIPHAKPTFMAKSGFLFVGRLEQGKGIVTLLETWQHLKQNYILKIIGSGPLEDDLKRKFQKENIVFLGSLSSGSVQLHMANAKFLIQPSLYYETFGLTILEAMAQGTPVIGFNIGTRPEFIEHNKNGFIVESEMLEQSLFEFENIPNYHKLC
ncbi:MAG TPA: glycosyltransferase, partial [Gammaproteobacteria bacterium]|nr:glycosyltransferase [Gammaproteobacteria bacterium]